MCKNFWFFPYHLSNSIFTNCSDERKGIFYQTTQFRVQPKEFIMHMKWMKIKFILDAVKGNPFRSLKDLSASETKVNPEVKRRHTGVFKCQFNIDYCQNFIRICQWFLRPYFKASIYVTSYNFLFSSVKNELELH